MDKEKYRSQDWQENKLKELYYAFGTSEEEGLTLFLNLVFELKYHNPSFLEKVYHTIDEIKQEAIYDITEKTLDWVQFWKSISYSDHEKFPLQLEKLKQLENKNYISLENLGRLFYEMGFFEIYLQNPNSAVENFQYAIRSLPDWSWPYIGLGIVYSDLNRQDEAIVSYKKAIELDPKNSKVYNNLGNVYKNLGRKEDAIASYQKAIELDQKYATAYNNLGIVYSDLGRKEEAIAWYQKAIELDPKDATPHNNLGYLLLNDGKLEKAKSHLERSIAINADDYCALINLGITYFQLRDKKKAQAHLGTALEKCPLSSVYGSLNKVTALLGLERKVEALESVQQTNEQFNIQPAEKEAFFKDWNLLAASPEPPAGICEFIEQAKAMLLDKE
jgi:tetratricopeptide (TPR) repeat protein